jgi:hypothetical protein
MHMVEEVRRIIFGAEKIFMTTEEIPPRLP